MAERSKATVLKTVEQQCSVGSNPTPSATLRGGAEGATVGNQPGSRRGARVAESDRLLIG